MATTTVYENNKDSNNITDNNEPLYYVRISNKYNQVNSYRQVLLRMGFALNPRSNNHDFYEKLCNKVEADDAKNWAQHYKLRCDIFEDKYARNAKYRETYFKANKPVIEARYRCAYCGRTFKYKDTTVDHIFPVNKMCYSEKTRRQAERYGIHETNEEKNLVACCRKCNSKKGTKTGWWIYKGLLGKKEWLWVIRKGIRLGITLVVTGFVASFVATMFFVT